MPVPLAWLTLVMKKDRGDTCVLLREETFFDSESMFFLVAMTAALSRVVTIITSSA
ncbi:MAG: hypothetical protein H0T78_08535 [Longispora sp.]|nr:hypothetical protein [Longispora sp. (in: high G+C Gram-positive bacteria)]